MREHQDLSSRSRALSPSLSLSLLQEGRNSGQAAATYWPGSFSLWGGAQDNVLAFCTECLLLGPVQNAVYAWPPYVLTKGGGYLHSCAAVEKLFQVHWIVM